jgi:hypothetical protein
MIHPHTKAQLFIPDEIKTSSVLSFDKVADILAVMDAHSLMTVHAEGFGPMRPEEFKLACTGLQSR